MLNLSTLGLLWYVQEEIARERMTFLFASSVKFVRCLCSDTVYYVPWVNFTSDAKYIKHLHKVEGRINSIW